MDIGQLKALVHVAECGSLSRAAESLNIVQPALSRKIRLLEQELGVLLFERHGRGMVLTDAGRRILENAARVLDELDSIRRNASARDRPLSGTVVVGLTPTVAEFLSVPLVRRAAEAHPGLSVCLSSAFSGHLTDWLQRGDVDLALSYDPEKLATIRIRPVITEDLFLVCNGQDDACVPGDNGPVPFSKLGGERLVLPSARHGLRKIVDACALRAGVTIKPTVEADSFNAMLALVRSGFGATVLPLPPVYDLVRAGVLRVRPIVDPAPARVLVIASSADRGMTEPARFIADTFVDLARDLVSRNIWSGQLLV